MPKLTLEGYWLFWNNDLGSARDMSLLDELIQMRQTLLDMAARHGAFNVRLFGSWHAIANDLPALQGEVARLLRESGEGNGF